MGKIRVLQMSANLESLGELRDFVRAAAVDFHAGPDEVADLILAVNEAVTNVILHGYRGQPGPIEILIRREGDALHTRLRDQAPPFDPTRLPEPELPRSLVAGAAGGLGAYLMRRSVDGISYRQSPQGGNELTLIKRIHHPGSNEEKDE
jgi:serine/threonine-protein kinase RsbW